MEKVLCTQCKKPAVKRSDTLNSYRCRNSNCPMKTFTPDKIIMNQKETKAEKYFKPSFIPKDKFDEMILKHDPEYIIDQKVKELKEDQLWPEKDFIKLCNLNSGYRAILDDSKYEQYRGRSYGCVYWSHPKTIEYYKSKGKMT